MNIVYCLLSIMFTVVAFTPAFSEIKIDSISSTSGTLGQDLILEVNGHGFDEDTRAVLLFDEKSILGFCNGFNTICDIVESDNILYVADCDKLSIIDINTPSNPIIKGVISSISCAYKLEIIGNIAFLLHGFKPDGISGIQMIDISDPSNPFIIGLIKPQNFAVNFTVSDNIIYLAEVDSGLELIDIKNPYNPFTITIIDTPGSARDVAINDNTAYIADYDMGLQIIDIREPSKASIIGSFNTSNSAYHIIVNNNMAYVPSHYNYKLQIIDINEPLIPKNKAYIELFFYDNIAVKENLVYVNYIFAGIEKIDIKTPLNPIIIDKIDEPFFKLDCKIKTSENNIFIYNYDSFLILLNLDIQILDCTPTKMKIKIPTPSVAGKYKLKVYDSQYEENVPISFSETFDLTLDVNSECVSIPLSFTNTISNNFITNYTVTIYSSNQQLIANENISYDLIADSIILQITPTKDEFGSTQITIQLTNNNICHKKNISVIVQLSEFKLISLSPVKKVLGKELEITVEGPGFDDTTQAIVVPGEENSTIGLTDLSMRADKIPSNSKTEYFTNGSSEIYKIDITNPTKPFILETFKLYDYDYFESNSGYSCIYDDYCYYYNNTKSVYDIKIIGKTAYVILSSYSYSYYSSNSLVILNISNLSKPTIISTINLVCRPESITIKNNNAYILSDSGFQIINITDLSHPVFIESFTTKNSVVDFSIKDSSVYLAYDKGFDIVDVSNSTNPKIIGSIDTLYEVKNITVIDNIAYVLDIQGFKIIDISMPSHPAVISSIYSMYFKNLIVTDRFAYVLDKMQKFHIIDISNPYHPTIITSMEIQNEIENFKVSDDRLYLIGENNFSILQLPLDIKNKTYTDSELSLQVPSPILPGIYQLYVYNPQQRFTAQLTFENFISGFSDKYIAGNSDTIEIPVQLNDESMNDYTISISSSNQELISDDNIHLILNDASKILQLSPSKDRFGTAQITMEITNGREYQVENFSVSVQFPEITISSFSPSYYKMGGELEVIVDDVPFDENLKAILIPDQSNLMSNVMNCSENELIVDFEVIENKAYVLKVIVNNWYRYSDLSIIDINNPFRAIYNGHIKTSLSVGFTAFGSTAYILDFNNNVHQIDINNPCDPSDIGMINISNYMNEFTFPGNEAYDAGLNGLQMIYPYNTDQSIFSLLPRQESKKFNKIKLKDGIAYLANGDYGFQIVDYTYLIIYDPINQNGFNNDVVIVDNIAYIADGQNGVKIIDIKDSANPIDLGNINIAASSINVNNNKAYVLGDELYVIDINNPLAPIILFSIDIPDPKEFILLYYDEFSIDSYDEISFHSSRAIQVTDKVIYIATDGLSVLPKPIDIKISERPDSKLSLQFPSPSIEGEYQLKLYNPQYEDTVQITIGDFLLPEFHDLTITGHSNSIAIPFIITPTRTDEPEENYSISFVSSNQELVSNDNISLTTTGIQNNLQITPTRDQFGTTQISMEFATENNIRVKTFLLVVQFAEINVSSITSLHGYVGKDLEVNLEGQGFDNNLKVVLVPDNSNCIKIFDEFSNIEDIAVENSILYAACRTGLKLLNISNPLSATIINSVPNTFDCRSVTVNDRIAYLSYDLFCYSSPNFQKIDLSNPYSLSATVLAYAYSSILSVGEDDFRYNCIFDGAYAISAINDIAYALGEDDQGGNFKIVQVGEEGHLTRVFSSIDIGSANDLTVLDQKAYIANGNEGLSIYDVSIPSEPTKIGSLDLYGSANDIYVCDNKAYVNSDNNYLHIIDISNPSLPRIIESFYTSCHSVAGTGDILITAKENSLYVFPLTSEVKITSLSETKLSLKIPPQKFAGNYQLHLYNPQFNETTNISFAGPFSELPDLDLLVNTESVSLPLNILDIMSDESIKDYTISASSSNQELVSNNNIVINAEKTQKKLYITPTKDQTGVTEITLLMTNGNIHQLDKFSISVHTEKTESYAPIEISSITPSCAKVGEDTIVTIRGNGFDHNTHARLIPDNENLIDDIFDGIDVTNDFEIETQIIGYTNTTLTLQILSPILEGNYILKLFNDQYEDNIQMSFKSSLFLTKISDVWLAGNSGSMKIPLGLTITGAEDSIHNYTITAFSSNQSLVANNNLSITSLHAKKVLHITPTKNQSGTTKIFLKITDGSIYKIETFSIVVHFPKIKILSIEPDSAIQGENVNVSIEGYGFSSTVGVLLIPGSKNSVLGVYEGLSYAKQIDVFDNKAYVTQRNLLKIFDITRPCKPIHISSFDIPENPYDIDVVDGKVYIASGDSGLVIMNVSNPLKISTNTVETPFSVKGVKIIDEQIFLSSNTSLFQVSDLNNLDNQNLIVDVSYIITDFEIIGDIAYVLDGEPRFHIVNFEKIDQPTIATIEIPGTAYDVAVTENIAYVTIKTNNYYWGYTYGLLLIDITDSLRPIIIDTIDLDFLVKSLDIFNHQIFLVGDSNLSILPEAIYTQILECSETNLLLNVPSAKFADTYHLNVYNPQYRDNVPFTYNVPFLTDLKDVYLKGNNSISLPFHLTNTHSDALIQGFKISVFSSNEDLISNANISLSLNEAENVLHITPNLNQYGVAHIFLEISNDFTYHLESFPVIVQFEKVMISGISPLCTSLGHALTVTIEGSGFDENTKALMIPDLDSEIDIIENISLETINVIDSTRLSLQIPSPITGGNYQIKLYNSQFEDSIQFSFIEPVVELSDISVELSDISVKGNAEIVSIPLNTSSSDISILDYTITVVSSNQELISNDSISIISVNGQRKLVIKPTKDQYGQSEITVEITNGSILQKQLFSIAVQFEKIIISSITPLSGIIGEDMEVNLTGIGFDNFLKAILIPDTENSDIKTVTPVLLETQITSYTNCKIIIPSPAIKGKYFFKLYNPQYEYQYPMEYIGPFELQDIVLPGNSEKNSITFCALSKKLADSIQDYSITISLSNTKTISKDKIVMVQKSPINLEITPTKNKFGDANLNVKLSKGNRYFTQTFNVSVQFSDITVTSNLPDEMYLQEKQEITIEGKGFDEQTKVCLIPDFTFPIFSLSRYSSSSWNGARDISFVDNLLYINNFGALLIIDVSNPLKPNVLSDRCFTYDEANENDVSYGIDVINNTAYLADGKNGLLIIDVSNPVFPKILGSYVSDYSIYDVSVIENIAYLAMKDVHSTQCKLILQLVDIIDPSNPKEIGSNSTPVFHLPDQQLNGLSSFNYCRNLFSYTKDIHECEACFDRPSSFPFYSKKENEKSYYAKGIIVKDKKAYLAHSYYGLQIFDITNPVSPSISGSIDIHDWFFKFEIVDNIAIVGDFMIDISDSLEPDILEGYHLLYNFWMQVSAFTINEKKLYVNNTHLFSDSNNYWSNNLIEIFENNSMNIASKNSLLIKSLYLNPVIWIWEKSTSSALDLALYCVSSIIPVGSFDPFVPFYTFSDLTDTVDHFIKKEVTQLIKQSDDLVYFVDNEILAFPFTEDAEIINYTKTKLSIKMPPLKYAGNYDLRIYNCQHHFSKIITFQPPFEIEEILDQNILETELQTSIPLSFTSNFQQVEKQDYTVTVKSGVKCAFPDDRIIVEGEGMERMIKIISPTIRYRNIPIHVTVNNGFTSVMETFHLSIGSNNFTFNYEGLASESISEITAVTYNNFLYQTKVEEIVIDKNTLYENSIIITNMENQIVDIWDMLYGNNRITGIAIDSDEFIYIADNMNNTILVYNTIGQYIATFGSNVLNSPEYIHIAENGDIYVSEADQQKVKVFKKVDYTEGTTKAIIIVGTQKNDNIIKASEDCADLAYRAMTYQGLDENNILYLSPDTQNTFIDTEPSLENIEIAITQWATGEESEQYGSTFTADSLVIYLVDHGAKGYFMVNESEMLSASVLNTWLDMAQETIIGRLIVIYEACYSGSFIPFISQSQNHRQRIVITSSRANEQSELLHNGAISFSNYFWSSIFNGKDIKTAFEKAKGLGAFEVNHTNIFKQYPQLDANGNAAINEDSDIREVQNVIIGNGKNSNYVIFGIPEVSPQKTLTANSAAEITASGVWAIDGISEVWAQIIPLNYSEIKSVSLPYVEMKYNDSENVYKGEYNHFYHEGTYVIGIFVKDKKGRTSNPKYTQITVNNPKKQSAIIVIGNTPEKIDISEVKKLAITSMKSKLYFDEDIIVIDNNSDYPLNASGIKEAIDHCVSRSSLDIVFYMIGEGTQTEFFFDENETISKTELNDYLNDIQNNNKLINITVVYDAPYGKDFLTGLVPPTHKKRILVSSTQNAHAFYLEKGTISFSWHFWNMVSKGFHLFDVFLNAHDTFSDLSWGNQIPEIIYGKELSKEYTIGYDIGYLPTMPHIKSVSPQKVLHCTQSSEILARNVHAFNSIDKVVALIFPPKGISSEKNEPDVIQLTNTGNSKDYSATYDNFSLNGEYDISICAFDTLGNMSDPLTTTVIQTVGTDCIISALQVLTEIDTSDSVPLLMDFNNDDKIGLEEAIYYFQKCEQ